MVDTATPEAGADPGSLEAAAAAFGQMAEQELPPADQDAQPEATLEPEEPTGADDLDAETAPEDAEPSDQREAEPEASEDEPEPAFTVKVNGEEFEVSQSELVNGYQRQADYTAKTERLAADRREFDEAVQTATHVQQQNLATSQALLQHIANEYLGAQPNWDELRATDPDEYLLQRETFRERQDRLGQLVNVIQQNVQAAQADQQKKLSDYREQQSQLLIQRRPDLANPEAATAWGAKLRGYLSDQGFNENELKGLMDVRQIDLAEKAMKWDELQSKKPTAQEAVRKKPAKTMKPGDTNRPRQSSAQSRFNQAQRNLASNPKSVDAAAAAIGALNGLAQAEQRRR